MELFNTDQQVVPVTGLDVTSGIFVIRLVEGLLKSGSLSGGDLAAVAGTHSKFFKAIETTTNASAITEDDQKKPLDGLVVGDVLISLQLIERALNRGIITRDALEITTAQRQHFVNVVQEATGVNYDARLAEVQAQLAASAANAADEGKSKRKSSKKAA